MGTKADVVLRRLKIAASTVALVSVVPMVMALEGAIWPVRNGVLNSIAGIATASVAATLGLEITIFAKNISTCLQEAKKSGESAAAFWRKNGLGIVYEAAGLFVSAWILALSYSVFSATTPKAEPDVRAPAKAEQKVDVRVFEVVNKIFTGVGKNARNCAKSAMLTNNERKETGPMERILYQRLRTADGNRAAVKQASGVRARQQVRMPLKMC